MKKIIFALFICWMAGQARADEATWLDNVPQAIDQAKRENKVLLLDFTGSDWCGWCKKLVAETFSQPEFIDYARKNLVLVEVDFPAHKSQPAELKEANKALKAKYGVSGYPSLVVLRPDGTVLWKQTGFLRGGPSAMIAKLNEVRSQGGAVTITAPTTAPPPVAAQPVAAPAPWTPTVPRKAGDEPKLQAILYSSHPSVMLDNEICVVGESVRGMRVMKIEHDKVTVEWNGEVKELRIKGAAVN